ncbi:MAG: hypothetical protein ACP6IS_05140 [Candidatus Asgardarchaeia archaeon]
MSEKIVELAKRYQEKKAKLEVLRAKLESSPYKNSWIEYKMVRNKTGKEYRYYYLRWIDKNGKKKSKYLGTWGAAQEIYEKIKEARELRKKIRIISNEIKELKEKIKMLMKV